MTKQQTFDLLKNIEQTQLLQYYEELSKGQKEKLLKQIENTNWSVLKTLQHPNDLSGKGIVEPIEGLRISEIEKRKEEFYQIGKKAIQEGKVGAVLLAGGQGTRLGFDGPKGAYNIGLTHSLYIFEQQIHNLMEVTSSCGAFVPIYIMTSDKNNQQTIEFWEKHNYFNYPKEYIKFFEQEMAPSVDFNGKVLLETKDSISLSPNGNGGWFSSLKKSGLINDIQKRGIEWLNTYAVDNVLQRIADPVFVGATIQSGCNCGAKVVCKVTPNEKVGVLCLENKKPNIIEYYELTEEMAQARDKNGDLQFIYGVILNYLFNVKKALSVPVQDIPVHIVKKKIPYLAENGQTIKPTVENGYKFETLILDMIKMMDTCLPFEVERTKEFAPVKNAQGVDSVESARSLLQQNGIKL